MAIRSAYSVIKKQDRITLNHCAMNRIHAFKVDPMSLMLSTAHYSLRM